MSIPSSHTILITPSRRLHCANRNPSPLVALRAYPVATMFAPARNLFRNTRAASRSLQRQNRTAGNMRMRPEKLRLYQLMFGSGRIPLYQPKTSRRMGTLATEHIRVYDQTYVVRLPTHVPAWDALRQWYPNLYYLLLQENATYLNPSEDMWDNLDYNKDNKTWDCEEDRVSDYETDDEYDDYWGPSHEDYEEMWDRLDYQEWVRD